MICKKCGKEIKVYDYISGSVESYKKYCKENDKKISNVILTKYKGYHRFFYCKNCNEPIDYKDMSIEMFFTWLKYSSESGDSHEQSGKAIIRYFELDKLLSSHNIKDGDNNGM